MRISYPRVFLIFLVAAMMIVFSGVARAQDSAGGSPAVVATPPAEATPTPALQGLATITAPKTQIEVGETVALNAKIPLSGEFEKVELKLPDAQLADFYVTRTKNIGPSEFTIEIVALHAGQLELGPAVLRVQAKGAKEWSEMATDRLNFVVAEPGAKPELDKVRGFTNPLDIPFNYLYRNIIIVVAAILILVISGAVFGWLFARSKRRAAMPIPARVVSPVDEALMQVRDLKRLETFELQGAEKHYTQLSTAVRGYLQSAYRVNAMERTEDEIVDLLRDQLASTPLTGTLVDIMRRMSLAKFARQEPTAQIAFEDCVTAEGFLVSERDRLRGAASSRVEGKAA